MCLYPRLLANPKYKPNKKNGGKPPFPQDPRVTKIPIPCGNCIECRKTSARNWQIRLLEEIRLTPLHPTFVTLTFSDESIAQLTTTSLRGYTLDNQIATQATRYFLERWRKTHSKSLRHWLITELGHQGTNNVHLHGLLFYEKKEQQQLLQDHWQYGHTHQGTYVNDHTIAYIIKYVNKAEEKYKHYKPIILTSPGMGSNYINRQDAIKNKFNEEKTNQTYKTTTGHQIALPTYYRNKIYTESEREALWLHKLDEQKRYVLGQEIDVSQNHDTYLNILQHARQKNTQLGYGTDNIDYDQKKYEQQIRQQMQETRIIKGKQKQIDEQIKTLNQIKDKWLIDKWTETPF